jgi:1-aminocyclopropane-1-carboxylate deaminase/D-cysteine desulfhydrase-like pyridoxal-dependent ACC family enzyme
MRRRTQSPLSVERIVVRGRHFFVKRDDQLCLARSGVSGNKARKMWVLNEEGPAGVWGSFGGYQSNAMLALSAVAKSRGARLVYFTKDIPKRLREQPSGNYQRALALGTEVVALGREQYALAFPNNVAPASTPPPPQDWGLLPTDTLWIPQGGSAKEAEAGIVRLADEIESFWATDGGSLRRPVVVVPAGTGTTALFLARHLQLRGVDVAAVPCVGDADYLTAQMTALDDASGGHGVFPRYLLRHPAGSAHGAHRFGAPSVGAAAVYGELQDAGLPLDLLYAPHAWGAMLDGVAAAARGEPGDWGWCDSPIMYYHCGGLEGVSSMVDRYRHLGIPLIDTIDRHG